METIRLTGDNESTLNIELLDILKLIPNGQDYEWKIMWINGVSKDSGDLDMLSFENKVKTDGFKLSFDELKKLSSKLYQLIEFVLVGKRSNIDSLDNSCTDELIKTRCDFFIELVDSSYWEITTSKKLMKEIN